EASRAPGSGNVRFGAVSTPAWLVPWHVLRGPE
ncbi:MAG: hypothetical protein RLZZ127_3353, partial [Planctomycetota bacterium]